MMLFAVVTAALPTAATASEGDASTTVIREQWLTERNVADNVDSVATWHSASGDHWLLTTAKDSDLLQVFDAASGTLIDRFGGTGDALGRFLRPNGMAVIDDLLLVVERDNQRVQVLALPDFQPLGAFGHEQLELPYGLWVEVREHGYRVYVTDAYERPGGRPPLDADLDRRLKQFEFRRHGNSIEAAFLGASGDTRGMGRLPKVESLFGDTVHDRLLVADESETDAGRVLKVYHLDGTFAGAEVGRGVFAYEPEGIALYACDDGSGYWIGADQHEKHNRFHLFDRESLDHAGSFSGAEVRNTDGISLTRKAMPGFPAGALYAVHDDGSVGAFRLDSVLDSLDLAPCEEEKQ